MLLQAGLGHTAISQNVKIKQGHFVTVMSQEKNTGPP